MKVQFIKTRDGEELAVLPRREYERLMGLAVDEDLGTRRIVSDARARLAVRRETLLPKAVVDRLASGQNPIRVLREWRDLTQAELVAAVGITQGYLSDLEAGKRKGPVKLHLKFAKAFGVPIDLLLPIAVSEAEADPARVARRGDVVKEMQERGR